MSFIFAASVDEHKERPSVLYKAGWKRWLASYYQMRWKNKDFMDDMRSFPDVWLMMDSGAFSLQGSSDELTETKADAYLKEYVSFLRTHKNRLFAAVELDLDSVLGWAWTRKAEEAYFEPLERDGVSVLYVWHPERGESEWEAMCRRHPYVGFSSGSAYGKQVFEIGEERIANFMAIAQKYCCKVHGFGFTRSREWKRIPFYSCDSKTWLAGEQWGMTITFTGDAISQIRDKTQRRGMKAQADRGNVDFNLLLKDDNDAVNQFNARAYVEFEEHIQRIHGTLRPEALWRHRPPPPSLLTDAEAAALCDKAGFDAEDKAAYGAFLAAVAHCDEKYLYANFYEDEILGGFRVIDDARNILEAQDNLYRRLRPEAFIPLARTNWDESFSLLERPENLSFEEI